MNMLNVSDMKWVQDSMEDVKRISEKVATVAPAVVDGDNVSEIKEEVNVEVAGEQQTAFAKMKAFVRKAVDCCIE